MQLAVPDPEDAVTRAIPIDGVVDGRIDLALVVDLFVVGLEFIFRPGRYVIGIFGILRRGQPEPEGARPCIFGREAVGDGLEFAGNHFTKHPDEKQLFSQDMNSI